MKPTTTFEIGGRETRRLSHPIELRAMTEGANGQTVFGYAAKFNTMSNNLGSEDYQFFEIIQPGAFDGVLNDDVRALFNHESELILARSKAGQGTLKIGVDGIGLWYEFEAPDTQTGRDLLVSLRRGDIDQSSFSFTVAKDGQSFVEKQDGDGPVILTRTITKVARLYDVSPVTYPAYEDTEVDSRSIEKILKEFRTEEPENQPEEPEENNSLSYWQQRMGLIDKTAV